MSDLAVVGLSFDTSSLAEGTKASKTSFDAIEKGALKTQAAVGGLGPVFEQVAQQSAKAREAGAQQARASAELTGWFEKEAAAIRAKSTVQLSEVQVYQRVKAAIEARVAVGKQLVAQEERERAEVAAVIQSNAAVNASSVATAGGIGGVGRAAVGTGGGLRTMATGLASLAASQVGVRAGLGSLATAVGFFAVGSLTSLGIIAGLTGLAFLYQSITARARETRQAIQDVITKLAEQYDAQLRTTRFQRETAQGEQTRLLAEIAKARAEAEASQGETFETGTGFGSGRSGRFLAAIQKQKDLTMELIGVQKSLVVIQRAGADESTQKREQEIQQLVQVIGLHKATTTDLARRAQIIAEDTAKLNAGNLTLAERSRLHAEINTLREAGTKGLDRELERLGRIKRANDEIIRTIVEGEGIQARVANGEDIRGRQLLTILTAQAELRGQRDKLFSGQLQSAPFTKDAVRLGFLPDPNAFRKTLDDLAREAQQRWEAALRTLTDATQRAFATLFKGQNPFEGLVNLAREAAASMAAAFTVRALGLDTLLKKITAGGTPAGVPLNQVGNAGVGAVTGIGALAGPIGVAAGIVGGFLSVISGGAERARAAAEALKVYNLNLADFIAIAHPRGALADALAQLTVRFEELAQQAAAASGVKAGGAVAGLSTVEIQQRLDVALQVNSRSLVEFYQRLLELRKITDENIAATKDRIALEQQQLGQDLNVEALRAQGRDAEADAEAFRLAQARKFAAVVDQFKGTFTAAEKAAFDATIQTLTYTQALQAEAFAKEQAFKAQQENATIEARVLENVGKDTEAAAARRAVSVAEEIRAAQKLVDQGIITQQLFNDFVASFDVMAESIAAATAAAEAQAAFNKRQTAFGIDAEIAGLLGNTAEADRINEDIRRANERNRVQGLFDQGVISQKQFEDWNSAFNKSLLTVFTEAASTFGGGATQAATAVSATVTDRTALMLVDINRAELTVLHQIETNTRSGGAGGRGNITIRVEQRFESMEGLTDAALAELGDKVVLLLNERLGSEFQGEQAFSGSVAR